MYEPFDNLVPMMERAKKEGLWFRSHYQHLWFSPEDLEEEWKNKKFLWGACNWTLLKPEERLSVINKKIKRLEEQKSRFIGDLKG